MSRKILERVVSNHLAIVGTMMDVTQRKNIKETLQASEKEYRTLFEESRDAICITNRDGRLIDVNQSFLSLFGYTREWVKDLNFRELYVDPDEGSRFQQKIEVACTGYCPNLNC